MSAQEGDQTPPDESAPKESAPGAPPPSSSTGDSDPRMTFDVGLGFALGPDMSLLAGSVNLWLKPMMALSPTLQLGGSDDDSMIALSLNVKGLLDTDNRDLNRLHLYVEGGPGFMFLKDESKDDSDVGLFFNAGLGLNYDINQDVAVGTGILLDFMPGEVQDQRFIFTWRVMSMSF